MLRGNGPTSRAVRIKCNSGPYFPELVHNSRLCLVSTWAEDDKISPLNDEQMSNNVGIEHQPVNTFPFPWPSIHHTTYTFVTCYPGAMTWRCFGRKVEVINQSLEDVDLMTLMPWYLLSKSPFQRCWNKIQSLFKRGTSRSFIKKNNLNHLGFSKTRGTPKWLVYDGKPY